MSITDTYVPRYPSIHNYDIVARDSSGAPVPNQRIWGYCDGATIFVHEHIPLYLLSSDGKQYPVWGTEINLKTGELQF